GYAPLDTSGKVPAANLPAVTPPAWGAITGTLSSQSDLASALSGKQAALGFTPENAANKGQASGYAPLDLNSKVPAANLPATTWGSITGTLSSQSDLSTALAAKQNSIG